MKDYYSLLGVESSATKSEIKKNYRLLAAKFHPDINKDPDAAEKFIVIAEAYDVLSNKKTRAKYDLLKWQHAKQQRESADAFTTVAPPLESTRTKRNKSQRKRSLKYHQTTDKTKKTLQLVIESFYIVGRYLLHILGTTLFLAILSSVISQLSSIFEENYLRGIFVSALVVALVYIIFWILKNAFLELKEDLKAFSIFYKISQKKVAPILISVFTFVLFFYVAFLIIYF